MLLEEAQVASVNAWADRSEVGNHWVAGTVRNMRQHGLEVEAVVLRGDTRGRYADDVVADDLELGLEERDCARQVAEAAGLVGEIVDRQVPTKTRAKRSAVAVRRTPL